MGVKRNSFKHSPQEGKTSGWSLFLQRCFISSHRELGRVSGDLFRQGFSELLYRLERQGSLHNWKGDQDFGEPIAIGAHLATRPYQRWLHGFKSSQVVPIWVSMLPECPLAASFRFWLLCLAQTLHRSWFIEGEAKSGYCCYHCLFVSMTAPLSGLIYVHYVVTVALEFRVLGLS